MLEPVDAERMSDLAERLGADRHAALVAELAPLGVTLIDQAELDRLILADARYRRLAALVEEPGPEV